MLIKAKLDMIQFEINVVRHSKLIQTDNKKSRFRDGREDISSSRIQVVMQVNDDICLEVRRL